MRCGMSYRLGFLLSATALFFSICSNVYAAHENSADPTTVSAQSSPAITTAPSNKILELQLQTQELQLEQQLLQIKQKLLQLRQQDIITKPNQTPIDLQWMTLNNSKTPLNAVIGAYANGKPLYICHADYLEGTQPGQLTDQGCMITYGGRIFIRPIYQILTGNHRVIWKASSTVLRFPPLMRGPVILSRWPNYLPITSGEDIPVPGGYENGHSLYICRAMFNDQIHLGKVVADKCNIAEQGSEVPVATYEVLFAKGPN